jgi:hypothetical protein
MAIVWKTVTLPPAFLGVPYEAGLAMTAGAAVTAIGVNTGALPAGVTVSTSTDPRLVGTPTVTGRFTFTLTANDGGAQVSPSYSLTVYGAVGDEKSTGEFDTPSAVNAKRKLN